MGAKAKTACILTLGAGIMAAAPAAADTCSKMAEMRASSLAGALRVLSPDVLGKPADMWTEADFVNLLDNARACDGKPEGMKVKVDARYWADQLQPVMNAVLPLSGRTAAIREAYAPRWTWGEMPSCVQILSWKRDPLWFSDNSAEIFGKSLAELDLAGRTYVAGFAEECLPVMEAALDLNRMKSPDARAIVDDIEASVARENEAAAEGAEELSDALRLTHEGKRVPLAYIGENSRKMVAVANQAEKSGTKLTTEQMIMLSKWAEQVDKGGKHGPERLFADAIRDIVHRHMFNG